MEIVRQASPPCLIPKFIVWLSILAVITLTFCSTIERSLFSRKTVFSQGKLRFKFSQIPTRMVTSKRTSPHPERPLQSPNVFPFYHNHLPNAYIHPSNHSIYLNSVLAFVHNPKSGGSTVKVCMVRLLHQKPVLMFSKTRDKIREDLLNGDAPLEPYYMGDSSLGICDYGKKRPCSYFTMLREPYERAVSHYYFCQDGGNGCSPSNKSLEEFVLSACSTFFHQLINTFSCHESKDQNRRERNVCQTSWHCNSTFAGRNISRDQEDMLLKYVIDHLDSTFAVIGLLSEYESSLELFEHTFGLSFVNTCRTLRNNKGSYIFRENTSTNGQSENLSPSVLKETAAQRLRESKTIRKCMKADEAIYEKAKEIFEIQKRELLKRKLYES